MGKIREKAGEKKRRAIKGQLEKQQGCKLARKRRKSREKVVIGNEKRQHARPKYSCLSK